ncbi:hypothetical protein SPRG_00055 [Saprolegnia parasitica CBS 223.65]|uniref:Uncharacterized protein n=1 Tax=Saprolegnia parasitica (strain CBS 223.65) TaxID=695850 RepID=A0A067CX13_SAPPC|nr:hypothetical protein SPRG_00055 [Saprolegnia parasitica CBS 223.65]KDO35209.1 hypothetical protein SPRG_00055 [Saprolegnia parasitica CBS 223.65]|eukprot:XP_012193561.1 hypothetical protein SPRG_00055 [Saprolegnia parasitica CBS 223.65]
MTKQDAKTTSSADDVTFGDVEHQLPAAASAIDELVAAAAPAPADQAAIDDLQGADAAAGQDHETAVAKDRATAAALMDRVHEVQHVVPTGVSVNAEDDSKMKEPALKVPRVDAVRPPKLDLPEVVTQHILTIIAHEDTLEFVNAWPTALLPPAFLSLKALGGVVNLDDHWPCIELFTIPDEHKRLALTALPAFPSVKFDVDLAWRTAERLAVTLRELIDALRLVPQLELTWIEGDDAASHATLSDVVNAWSDKVTAVMFVSSLPLTYPTVREALARCVNLQRAYFQGTYRGESATLEQCVEAVTTPAHLHLHSLSVFSEQEYDANGMVAWLETPRAKALTLSCLNVRCNGCLAKAIATSTGLTSLSIDIHNDAWLLLDALGEYDLHRLTDVDLYMSLCAFDDLIRVLRRLDADRVTSLYVSGLPKPTPKEFKVVLARFTALKVFRYDQVSYDQESDNE